MNRLRELREQSGKTLKDIGEAIGATSMTVSRYERAQHPLTEESIAVFCDLYDVSADYLLGRSDVRDVPPQITQAELDMLMAYRRADDKSRGMVDYALAEFKQVGSVKAG